MNTPPAVNSFLERTLGVLVVLASLATFVWLTSLETLLLALSAGALCPPVFMLLPGVWWRRDARPAPARDHVSTRAPVWAALSEFYLDTELDEDDHARIAEVLLRSGYSAEQLEEILYREVHPAVFTNLLNMAGEWAGFDSEWLTERVLAHPGHGLGVALIPAKWMVHSSWSRVRARVSARQQERGESLPGPAA